MRVGNVRKDFDEPREKKKKPWFKIISLIFLGIATVAVGYLAVLMEVITTVEALECVVVIAISVYASVVIHELGHCIGGTLSHYRFTYLRVGGLALCSGRKEEGERALVLRKFKIPGAMGGCVMIPPRGVPYEDISYKAYFLGGALANLLSIPLSCAFLFPFPDKWYVVAIFSVVAFFRAMMSLVPNMQNGEGNDAYNLKLCKEDPETHRAFVSILCIMGEYTKGKSIGAMPEAWFLGKFSSNQPMPTNPIMAALWGATADRFLIHGQVFQAKVIYEAMGHAQDLMPLLRYTGLFSLLFAMLLEGRIEEAKIYDIPHFIQKAEKKLEPYYLVFARYRFGHGKLISDNTRNRNLALSYFQKVSKGYPFIGHEADQRLLIEKLDEVELHYGLWGV